MKKFILFLFLITAANNANAQSLKWFTDVNEASKEALKSKKPMLFFFTGSDWCGWCTRLQKEVLLTPEFATWADKNVVLVELDFPKRKTLAPEIVQQNKELQQTLGVRGYPTVWFVKANKPEKNGDKIAFSQLGSTGYVAGGPANWIASAESIINKAK